jgi:hypothetical protein
MNNDRRKSRTAGRDDQWPTEGPVDDPVACGQPLPRVHVNAGIISLK